MEKQKIDEAVFVPEYWDNHMPNDAHIKNPDIKLEYGHESVCFSDNLTSAVKLIENTQKEYEDHKEALRTVEKTGDFFPLDCYFPGTVVRILKEAYFTRPSHSYRKFEQFGVIMKATTKDNGSWNYVNYYSPSDTNLDHHEIGNLRSIEIGKTQHVKKVSHINPDEFRLERVLKAELLTLGRAREVELTENRPQEIPQQNGFIKVLGRLKRRKI